MVAPNSDGVREKDGDTLSFTLATSNDPQMVALADEISRQWRVIGVEADVRPVDSATFVTGTLLARRFQAALAVVSPGPDPDPYPFWHSSQAKPPGRNLAAYADPQADDALERARQTTDVQRRRDLYAQFELLFLSDVPAIPLFAPAPSTSRARAYMGFEDSFSSRRPRGSRASHAGTSTPAENSGSCGAIMSCHGSPHLLRSCRHDADGSERSGSDVALPDVGLG